MILLTERIERSYFLQVKSESHARDYVDGPAAAGRYAFTRREAQAALRGSAGSIKQALNRLARQKLLVSPARGFYVILPPEYRALVCLPADQFIPVLMKQRNLPYHAALLSAAQYHGAALHRPQEFQVFVPTNRPPIRYRTVRVAFIARTRLKDVPVQSFNTSRGTIQVSTPEATALDLIGYANHVGGLNQVATVLSELAGKIDPAKLAAVAETAPIPWAQRLGYLLERLGFHTQTAALKDYVRAHARQSAPLAPKLPLKRAQQDVGPLRQRACGDGSVTGTLGSRVTLVPRHL